MSNGYTITASSRRALAAFRRALPPSGSELRLCPPDCAVDHDAVRRDRLREEIECRRPKAKSSFPSRKVKTPKG